MSNESIIAAFRRACSGAGIDWLRAVREAGRLANELPSSRGKRSSSDLTNFCEEAGVTRQQVHTWRKVALVPDAEFESYCTAVESASHKPTIKGVLGGMKPAERKPKAKDHVCTVSLGKLSDRQRERFKHEIAELRATLGTETDGEAVLEAVSRFYADILKRRCAA